MPAYQRLIFSIIIIGLSTLTYGNAYADVVCPPLIWQDYIACFYSGVYPSIGNLAGRIYNFLLPLGLIIGLIAIVSSGYKIMTSQGNPEKVKDGSDSLTAAVTGVLFIVLSIVILRVIIRSLFDVSIDF